MPKIELTEEERAYRLDPITFNNQLIYWLTKSRCMVWNLRKASDEYEKLRLELDHATAFEILKKKMFELGLKEG